MHEMSHAGVDDLNQMFFSIILMYEYGQYNYTFENIRVNVS